MSTNSNSGQALIPVSWIKAELNRAYLECLLLDRERLDDILQKREDYQHAYLTATKMLEHLRLHPDFKLLLADSKDAKSSHQLAIHLDYVHRELGTLAEQSPDQEFFRSLQKELGYLLPKLWHPPEEQERPLQQLLERILKNARLYDNLELSRQLVALRERENPYPLMLRSIDIALARSWPQQVGLVITQDMELVAQISRYASVSGLKWTHFQHVKEALQHVVYQEPCLVITTPEQARHTVEHLLREYPQAKSVMVVREMAAIDGQSLPDKINHILEERWLERFLPGLVHRHLMERWRNTHRRTRDALTSLPTVMGTRMRYEQLQELFGRFKGPFTLAIISLPELREIEHREGPYLASEWLRAFAKSLQHYLRNTDVLGRWSPDKFILLLPQTSMQGALIALERCHKKLEQENPIPSDKTLEGKPLFQAGLTSVTREMNFEEALFKAHQQLKQGEADTSRYIYFDQNELERAKRPHILLLDDDPVIQEMLRFIFSREGYQVTQMTNGEKILEVLAQEPVSLLILDVKMPGMDGFEVLETIRSSRQYDDLPIVMLTSMKGEQDIARGFELGANDFLNKPFSPTELVIRTKRFLR